MKAEPAGPEGRKVSAKVMKGEGPCTKANSVAISQPVAEVLRVTVGDPILIKGSRTTVAVIESIEGMRQPVIYFGRASRMNAGAHWDESVQLQELTQKEAAEEVIIGPSEEDKTLDADPDALKGVLIGTYVATGDILEVGTRTFRNIFGVDNPSRFTRIMVVKTKPSGFVQIVPETELVISKEFKEAGRSSVTYDDIGGQHEIIEKVRELVELPLRNPELFKYLGVESPKGVLLHGPPGTGKTLLAKAVANESEAYFINIGASHLPIHDAERRLREIFAEAAQHIPSVIFIDEIDTIAPKREDSLDPNERRVVGALLELMDGMKNRGQVIVIAATNRPNALDPALRRPGRFDKEIEIPMPDEDGRLEILQIHVRYMPLDSDVKLEKLAESTAGYSGADLRLLCSEAAMSCIRRHSARFNPDGTVPAQVLSEMKVNMSDFIEGTKRITPSCGREVIVEIPKVKWDQVGGYRELKSKISELVLTPWRNTQEANKFGVRVPKGILLYGPPGTGKTYLAKAIANEACVKVIVVSGASLKSKWFGEYEQNIARVFEAARKAAPVVIIIDEVESIASRRAGGFGEASRALDSGVNEFLRQLDGVQEIHDVFLICTTNRPDILDEAFLRSGRVDHQFYLPPPDLEARIEIFNVHMANVKVSFGDDVEVKMLAKLTEGLNGADIKMIVEAAVRKWFYDYINNGIVNSDEGSQLKVGMQYFLKAIEEARSNLTRRWKEDEVLPIQVNA
ncbi:MAG: AAA family ATPase [Thermoproteota archaeon]